MHTGMNRELEMDPVSALQDSRLQDFGGVEEVVLHFKQATSREACRNLFSILLDWAVSKHQV